MSATVEKAAHKVKLHN